MQTHNLSYFNCTGFNQYRCNLAVLSYFNYTGFNQYRCKCYKIKNETYPARVQPIGHKEALAISLTSTPSVLMYKLRLLRGQTTQSHPLSLQIIKDMSASLHVFIHRYSLSREGITVPGASCIEWQSALCGLIYKNPIKWNMASLRLYVRSSSLLKPNITASTTSFILTVLLLNSMVTDPWSVFS